MPQWFTSGASDVCGCGDRVPVGRRHVRARGLASLARSAPQVRLDLTEMEPEESLPAVRVVLDALAAETARITPGSARPRR